jgi:low temperature requirement protein LtrA
MNTLWQAPRLRQDNHHERRASWLELFFDLVFVATIGELGKRLSDDVSVFGFAQYVVLFIPIWWCWIGETFYANRFDQDSLIDRLVTLVQMSILVVMAVNAHHGLDSSSIGFGLSYIAFRIVLVAQYVVAGIFNPQTRPMIRHFSGGFSLSIVLWLISLVVPTPLRFWIWGLGLIIDFITPVLGQKFIQQFPPNMTHIPERMGLFTIIVLGESLFAAITGLSKQDDWGITATAIAVLGLVSAFSLWWMYFETVDGSPLSQGQNHPERGLLWLYLHLPLAIGITAAGVGTKYAIYKGATTPILSDAGRGLLCGSYGLCLASLALLHWLTCSLGARRRELMFYRLGGVAAVAIVALAGHALPGLAVAGAVASVGAVQIGLDIVRQLRQGSIVPGEKEPIEAVPQDREG